MKLLEVWKLNGACAEHPDPDMWFTNYGSKDHRHAAMICRTECAVQDQCASYAMYNREPFGIWGGLHETERDMLLSQPGTLRAAFPEDPAA